MWFLTEADSFFLLLRDLATVLITVLLKFYILFMAKKGTAPHLDCSSVKTTIISVVERLHLTL